MIKTQSPLWDFRVKGGGTGKRSKDLPSSATRGYKEPMPEIAQTFDEVQSPKIADPTDDGEL